MSEHQTPDERFVAERLDIAANVRTSSPNPAAVLAAGRRARWRHRVSRAALAVVVLTGVGAGVTQVKLAEAQPRDVVVPAATPAPHQDDSSVAVRNDAAVDDARYPFRTPEDWTTYADHVVVATVVAEKPGEKFGSGRLRTLTVRVDETLWSSAKPRRAVPGSFTIKNTWGWDGETRIAIEKRSRLEVGHTYVLPLRWEPARCSEGDEKQPGYWGHLAGQAPLPYDEGTIGTGEIAGSYVRAADAQWDDYTRLYDMDSVRVVMNERTAADLRALLDSTPSRTDTRYDRPSSPCQGDKG